MPSDTQNTAKITQADLARHWGVTPMTSLRAVRAGCPLTSIADADAWRAARPRLRKRRPAVAAASPPPVVPATSGATDDLRAFYDRLCASERAANDYMLANPDSGSARHNYNKAAELRLNCEAKLQEAIAHSGELIPRALAEQVVTSALGPLLAKLKAFSTATSPRANPGDPELARMAIEDGLRGIYREIEDFLGKE
jgi:hypothetical protein